MIEDCLEVFERQHDIDKLILDTYMPKEGTYIIMKYNGEVFIEDDKIEVKKNKKEHSLSITKAERNKISKLDYYCKLLEQNKPIDSKKIIHSNSYLGFSIKKESLINGKLTPAIISQYYSILKNPRLKYTKKQDLKLYERVEEEIGMPDIDKISLVETWVQQNIFLLKNQITIGKDYLKIFFLFDDIDVEIESKRYFITNIFNKNDYNVELNDSLYGFPNNNIGLSSKKTYLEHKDRKNSLPILESTDKVMKKKKFFDFLLNQAAMGKYNLYFPNAEDKNIEAYSEMEIPENFDGYRLRIRNDKNEAAIIDADVVTGLGNILNKTFIYQNVIDLPTTFLEKNEYGATQKRTKLMKIISNVFFNNNLEKNLYSSKKEMKGIKDPNVRQAILMFQNAYSRWFYSGYEVGMENVFKRTAELMIKNSIDNNAIYQATHQFNLKCSLNEYYKGEEGAMKQTISQIRANLKEKINVKDFKECENDDEYSYAVGQLIRYLLEQSKSKKKQYSLGNTFLTLQNDMILKQKVKQLFMQYNYLIQLSDYRIGNLLTMIMSYQVQQKINQDLLLAGYVSNNLLFEKINVTKEDMIEE